MKKFSAHYIYTNKCPALKRGIVTAEDNGVIINARDTGGVLEESESVEFHNGIIIPGFVNCHCHLELSHMKGAIPPGTGLAEFVRQLRTIRESGSLRTEEAIRRADNEMYTEGIVLCADICNTTDSFEIKTKTKIKYINLLEVFGIDPEKADKRLEEILNVAKAAQLSGIQYWIVPHSAYSLSLPLFEMLKEIMAANRISSMHFMESKAEELLLRDHSGPFIESYKNSGLLNQEPVTVKNHSNAVLNEITRSGNLILVHDTYATRELIRETSDRNNLYWCLCLNSNIYIENHIPPVNILREEECELVIGTDSLSSNSRLSILEELKTIQDNFPSVILEELVKWATINGAKALCEENLFGSIEPGKKPGLLLLENIDLQNMKLLPETRVKRLL